MPRSINPNRKPVKGTPKLQVIDAAELAARPLPSYPPEPDNLTWEEMVEIEPRLGKLLEEVPRCDNQKKSDRFCGEDYWWNQKTGFKAKLKKLVGFTAKRAHDRLRTMAAYDIAHDKLFLAMPPCRGGCAWCGGTDAQREQETAYDRWRRVMDEGIDVDPAVIEQRVPSAPVIDPHTLQEKIEWITALPEYTQMAVVARLYPQDDNDRDYAKTFNWLTSRNYPCQEMIIDGKLVQKPNTVDPTIEHNICVVVDKFFVQKNSPCILGDAALLKTLQNEWERTCIRPDIEELMRKRRIKLTDYFLPKTFLERRIAEAIDMAYDLGSVGIAILNEAATAPAADTSNVVVPVDLWAKPEPPPLPTGLLPAAIEELAFEQGELMGAEPDGLAMSALTVCTAVIPDHIKVQVKKHDLRWKESTRLWVALVGDPSKQKSPIMRLATERLMQLDTELRRAWGEAKRIYDELDAKERRGAEKPRKEFLAIEDVTPESTQEIAAGSPDGLFCFRDELGGWFGSIDKYAGHRGAAMDRGFWLQAYNGAPYRWDRVARGSGVIENLSVSILGGIHLDTARDLLLEGVDDGLIQRLNPIMLRTGKVGLDEPTSPSLDRYEDLVDRLYGLRRNCHYPTVFFDDDARVIRRQLEERHHDHMACQTLNTKLRAHIGKYNGMYARLCLLWHLIEHQGGNFPIKIDAETAQRVADFMHKFLLPHAFAFYNDCYGLSDGQDQLKAIAGYILAHKLETINNRDVQRGDRCMRGIERQETEKLFERLDSLGWLIRVPGKRFSDPPRWNVNPEVHHRFKEYAEQEAERRQQERKLVAEIFAQQRKDQ